MLFLPRAPEVCAHSGIINRGKSTCSRLSSRCGRHALVDRFMTSPGPYQPVGQKGHRTMFLNQNLNPSSNTAVATDTPQPKVAPEALVDQLRMFRAQVPELTPLTPAQRTFLRKRAQTSNAVLMASINVIGASDGVSQVLGQPAVDARSMQDEANRWTAVEDELKALLNGVSSANLIRRQRLALLAAQAVGIGAQLARDPANAALVPHVQEVKRLKKLESRKKPKPPVATTTTPQSPAPQAPAPHQLLDAPEVNGVK
jgi:hypothetical protein